VGKEPVGEALEALAAGRWDDFARALSRIRLDSWEDAASVLADAIASGASMLVEDARDLGRTDRPHHWVWGALLVAAGTLLLPLLIYLYGEQREG
jgi:hypothetical protein